MKTAGFVTLTSDTGLYAKVVLDAPSPILTGGFGGWEVVDRPKRVGLTRFKGKDPFRQDLAVIVDGWADQDSVEDTITSIERMAEQPSDLSEPPKITLGGVALRKDLSWIIESIDQDSQNTIWLMQGGVPVRLRQSLVIHLLEYVDDTVLVTPASPAIAAKSKDPKGKGVIKVVTPAGMTLKQLAQIEFGDPDKYMLIVNQNPWLNPDPRIALPPGSKLTIIGGSIPFYTVPGAP